MPAFLIAEDGDGEREFVVHCHYPSFILEFMEDQSVPYFIDSEEEFLAREKAAGRDPGATLARLIQDAGEFYEGC